VQECHVNRAMNFLNLRRPPSKSPAVWLLELIDRGENAFIEFKSSFQKEVIETLTAFANTQGGAVLNVSGQPESRPESQPESGQALEAKVLRLLSTTPMSKRGISAALGQKSVSGQLNKDTADVGGMGTSR